MAYLKAEQLQWVPDGGWANARKWRLRITDIYGTAHKLHFDEAWQDGDGHKWVEVEWAESRVVIKKDLAVGQYRCAKIATPCTLTGATRIWVPFDDLRTMGELLLLTKVLKKIPTTKQTPLPF